MQNLYPSISLKLFSYGIKCLHDPNWTGMFLYDQLQQHTRERIEPKELLRKPLERGVSFYLGCWFFEEYFSSSHVEDLHGEYKSWFLEDFYQMLEYHQFPSSDDLQRLKTLVEKIDNMFEEDEEGYWDYLDSKEGNDEILETYEKAYLFYEDSIIVLKDAYSEDFSDRMLHDRQLCFYTSKLLVQIGFDRDNDDTGPKAWVRRERWPERVKSILKARDRGLCTSCNSNLTMELEATIHIDHMVPIAKGGCNDIINLQILCDSCNLKKSSKDSEIPSSVPKYIKRKKT